MKNVSIVIGAGFGDEGKGLATSFLCSHDKKPLIIRYNGGPQAGHTVMHGDKKHVFSNFGSGTLQDVPTYWSEFCTFYPVAVRNELKHLVSIGLSPVLYVHPLCPVTTPFDRWSNIDSVQDNCNGTCGVGFGSTIQRQEDYFKLHVMDLFHESVLMEKLKNIYRYYENKTAPMGNSVKKNIIMEDFISCIEYIKDKIIVADLSAVEKNHDHLIFEGAQGILLDMDFGFFPNVTRSNTTSKNALALIQKYKLDEPEIYYVTRSYQTRHGNGFMTNEGTMQLKNNEHETNIENKYQGKFRTGALDHDLLNYALKCDNNFSNGLKKNIVFTCLDQTDGGAFCTTRNNKTPCTLDVEEVIINIEMDFEKVLTSNSPYSEKISHL